MTWPSMITSRASTGAEKIDFGAALNDHAVAGDGSIDFAVFTDDEIAGALSSALDLAFDDEVVSVNGDAGDVALFVNEDVAPGLDAGVVLVSDVVISESDVGTTVGAKGRLGVS